MPPVTLHDVRTAQPNLPGLRRAEFALAHDVHHLRLDPGREAAAGAEPALGWFPAVAGNDGGPFGHSPHLTQHQAGALLECFLHVSPKGSCATSRVAQRVQAETIPH